ncbi:MAG: carbamoyltransferase HypF [Chitinivibrionales bacterium]|nr:carbamoyltransferase HypF [Chitinivibrionales bacterium]
MRKRTALKITGRVQGVGFRPTVYRYAREFGLAGHVFNDPSAVIIEAEGDAETLRLFIDKLECSPPPLARIESITSTDISLENNTGFSILPSASNGSVFLEVPHDLATCANCRRELFDPSDRRFKYPFINCTNCGPRFTIINAVPYDRDRTSMRTFTMCKECQDEYDDPANRRFDAQPNACAVCGPKLSLIDAAGKPISGDPLDKTIELLQSGAIGAIKGLGGYHLACLATTDTAIAALRLRKHRPHKALAIMFASASAAAQEVFLSADELSLLQSPERPVVICKRKADSRLSSQISPDTNDIGVMLPYTPLHLLLLEKLSPLVMTSCNRLDEPLACDEKELQSLLGTIADFALTHNRPIVRRCDDSVVKIAYGKPLFIRRSRGYTPDIIRLPFSGPAVLAVGGQLKNTFCITRPYQAIISQHIGDLDEFTTFTFFKESIRDFCDFFKVAPRIIAHDLHPDYASTRFAQALEADRKIAVQHHHAHIAACMAENQLTKPVIGVALDGTGYGDDGAIWGGEFFVGDLGGFTRAAHFEYFPLPGGDAAIEHPWRSALGYGIAQNIPEVKDLLAALYPQIPLSEIGVVIGMINQKLNSPLTSSAGRLFDVVAALFGLCATATYEGQAAIRLQQIADTACKEAYPFTIKNESNTDIIYFADMVRSILMDLSKGADKSAISARFHNTLTQAIVQECLALRAGQKINSVALSGGVFQNDLLLERTIAELSKADFAVYHHTKVPPNDAGIALGQASMALAQVQNKE